MQKNDGLIKLIRQTDAETAERKKALNKLSEEYDQIDVEDGKIRQGKKRKLTDITKAQKQIETHQKQKGQLQERCTDIENQNPVIEERLKKAKANQEACDRVFQVKDAEVRKQTEQLRKELEKLEAPYNQISAQIVQAQAEVATKKTEIEDIKRRKEKIAAEKEQNQTQVEQLRVRIDGLAEELKGHTAVLEQSKQEQGALKEREAELRQLFDGLGHQLRESQVKFS